MSRLRPLLPRRRAAESRMRAGRFAAGLDPLVVARRYGEEPFTPERVPAAVAAEQEWPRVHVGRDRDEATGVLLPGWRWTITGPDGRKLGTDVAPTQPAALALGTAVLELVTMAWDLGVGQV